ncbi:aldo/keto reductase [Streptomyces griseoviridis]|uniref:Aldo/keto reductase n=2 Tax=Streptomyces TaxID=1883 RepID=A0A918GWQ2_STRGD|nr:MULTISPECIES: aldo/keto reductase [Streptomyces]GGS67293.1 aldo/keto reductase [Streptomyces niveoruber]GGU62999.1 aldo/keto reductase [Streptomyces daghestanicus]GHI29092.1 aldo/keto reductase [Streptomyces daghestanicus]
MERRILGDTGISVSELALGTMMFGSWGNPDRREASTVIGMALDAGVNLVDTADIYGEGGTEEIVGEALKGRRDDIVLATKFHGPMGPDDNHRGNSRRWIMRAVEDSLRRLGTDHIDLYQVHGVDPDTDIDETLSALSDLVRSGKVRAIGTSNFPADQLVEARWTAERRGHVHFRSEQPAYSVLSRSVEMHVLPTARRHGMGVLAWGPLSAGWLSDRDATPGEGRTVLEPQRFDPAVPANAAKARAVGRLRALAAEAGMPLTHLALGFVQAHPAVTSVIIGPRTVDQLTDLLAGAGTVLDDEVLDRIDEIVPPGSDLNPVDNHSVRRLLADTAQRRRPVPRRSVRETARR